MSYILFDIGGSTVKYALGDKERNLEQNGSIPTCNYDLHKFLENLHYICETEGKDRFPCSTM